MKRFRINIASIYVILLVAALFQFCTPKAIKTVTTGAYEEDLSVYRTEYEVGSVEPEKTAIAIVSEPKPDITPTHDIKAELDSVTKIIVSQREKIKYVDGYTVQLYSGNDRNKAYQVKREAYETIDGVKPRVTYEQPNYKVKIGEYYHRLSANADYELMKDHFSRAVLVPTKIRIDKD